MPRNYYPLFILSLWAHLVLISTGVSGGLGVEGVNLDLKRIDRDLLTILRVDSKPPKFRLIPKETISVSKVSFGILKVWDRKGSEQLVGISILSPDKATLLFILEESSGKAPFFWHLLMTPEGLGHLSSLELFSALNGIGEKLDQINTEPIDIGDPFDRLFFNYHSSSERGVTTEVYDARNGEEFDPIRDNGRVIWDPGKGGKNAHRVVTHTFTISSSSITQRVISSIFNNYSNSNGGEGFNTDKILYLVHTDGSYSYFRLEEKRWVQINYYNYLRYYNFYRIFSTANKSSKGGDPNDGSIELSSRSDKLSYLPVRNWGLRVVHVSQIRPHRVNKLLFHGNPLTDKVLSSFFASIIRGGDGTLIELRSRDAGGEPNRTKYFQFTGVLRTDTEGKGGSLVELNQSEYFQKIIRTIVSNSGPLPLNLDYTGRAEGELVSDLDEDIKGKIRENKIPNNFSQDLPGQHYSTTTTSSSNVEDGLVKIGDRAKSGGDETPTSKTTIKEGAKGQLRGDSDKVEGDEGEDDDEDSFYVLRPLQFILPSAVVTLYLL